MKLKANFYNDWVEILGDILSQNWGYDISEIPKDEIPLVYFNAEQRRVTVRPRKIQYSNSFTCLDELKKGWGILKRKIEIGQDITPHLSKSVLRSTRKDPLLIDWGVHHFHLGKKLEGSFTKRTGPLLFALVKNNIFYAIGMFSHGKWADESIVEIIHENWPEIILQYKTQDGMTLLHEAKPKERLMLRKNQINSFFKCSDGTIYAPIGGGSVASGYNIKSTKRMIQQKKYLNHLQDTLENELQNIKGDLEKQGYCAKDELEAKLEIIDDCYKAVFSKYNFSVILRKHA
ncbi:MAG: hypothetical protein V3U87_16175 [Methylococcaceae bacterium]